MDVRVDYRAKWVYACGLYIIMCRRVGSRRRLCGLRVVFSV